MTKKYFKISFLFLILLSVVSCKTEFEKVRVSGDTDLLYKKAFEYYDAKEYQKSQELLELLLGNLRGKVESEKVYFHYAYTQYFLSKYILASYYFKDFSTKFLNSTYREEADFMAAYSHYKLSPSYRLDQSFSIKAIEQFQLFVNTYPTSERVPECNTLIDKMRAKLEKKAFEQGVLYFNLKQYEASIRAFDNLLKDYPDSQNAEEVRYKIIEASYLFAENSILTKQAERFQETMDYYNAFVKKYSDSKYKKRLTTIYNNANMHLSGTAVAKQ